MAQPRNDAWACSPWRAQALIALPHYLSGETIPKDLEYPPWVVLHIPHDSIEIPASVRDQFLLDDAQLEAEIIRMTDHHTHALFADSQAGATVVRAPTNRFVVDVERFVDDEFEPMAARGMGVIYTTTSDLKPLRRQLSQDEREALLKNYYLPHHARLESAVTAALDQFDHCVVIDCHSFPGTALPYEGRPSSEVRPEICIGTDAFHTSDALASSFLRTFEADGWRVALNTPFSGALVPTSRYGQDRRVKAVMIEVNRNCYLRERSRTPLPEFADVGRRIRECCIKALEGVAASEHCQ